MYGRDRGERRGGFGDRRGGGGGFGRRPFRGGGGGGFNDDQPKPVKVGEEYDVKITDVGEKGDGITRIKNFIIFVAGAKKDEECRIRIKEVARKFAIAEKIGEAQGSTEQAEGSEETKKSESSEETSEESEAGTEEEFE